MRKRPGKRLSLRAGCRERERTETGPDNQLVAVRRDGHAENPAVTRNEQDNGDKGRKDEDIRVHKIMPYTVAKQLLDLIGEKEPDGDHARHQEFFDQGVPSRTGRRILRGY